MKNCFGMFRGNVSSKCFQETFPWNVSINCFLGNDSRNVSNQCFHIFSMAFSQECFLEMFPGNISLKLNMNRFHETFLWNTSVKCFHGFRKYFPEYFPGKFPRNVSENVYKNYFQGFKEFFPLNFSMRCFHEIVSRNVSLNFS